VFFFFALVENCEVQIYSVERTEAGIDPPKRHQGQGCELWTLTPPPNQIQLTTNDFPINTNHWWSFPPALCSSHSIPCSLRPLSFALFTIIVVLTQSTHSGATAKHRCEGYEFCTRQVSLKHFPFKRRTKHNKETMLVPRSRKRKKDLFTSGFLLTAFCLPVCLEAQYLLVSVHALLWRHETCGIFFLANTVQWLARIPSIYIECGGHVFI
jgi:hypothetical protein